MVYKQNMVIYTPGILQTSYLASVIYWACYDNVCFLVDKNTGIYLVKGDNK